MRNWSYKNLKKTQEIDLKDKSLKKWIKVSIEKSIPRFPFLHSMKNPYVLKTFGGRVASTISFWEEFKYFI